ncbi:histidinol-phosphate transaminase [Paenibacillus sp. 1011MAR3C5]|uniref:histidinol-phosphate transaminase n=1 Tax=Paenibacillus sp. 1011MAR3C5 TaxID=1675787 RepID=UPI000E6CE647|nr:histidinol-phosphate transaminase [Paenibacillus sp. 1011MAR3C5]RJE90054.1 histidinol-phosphate transaminase [Paenibacillus sp. 1011MAR3C5]
MQPKSNVVHLPVYNPGKPVEDVKRELGLDQVIKLASNENPYGFSNEAKNAMLAELTNSSIYPDGASVMLTNELARKLSVQTNQLIFGAGSSEVIVLAARTFLAPGDETIMANETFSQYRHNAQIENARIIEVPLKDGKHDLPAMLAKITNQTKIVWVCNPNNPTGTIVTDAELRTFLNEVPSHVLVVLDEAYREFVEQEQFSDGVELLKSYPNLLVLRTFSKVYGLAAHRIGYGVSSPEVIQFMNQIREPFNTTRIAQAGALSSLKDDAFVAACKARNLEGIRYMTEQFDRLGLSYFPANGNFILVDAKRPSGVVFDALLRKGVIVKGRWANYPTYIRVSVGMPEQNVAFIEALEQVLQEVTV